MDTTAASADSVAIGAAVIAKGGVQIAGRTGMAGYTRITTSTVQWTEVGDTLPGQPIYDTVMPFFFSPASQTAVTITGGRSFWVDVTVAVTGVTNVAGATFNAQVRAPSPSGTLLAQMSYEITGPLTVRFRLSPYQTQAATAITLTGGVWDAEMLLNGMEYTVVPRSKVTLIQGVSQGDGCYPDALCLSSGVALGALVVIS